MNTIINVLSLATFVCLMATQIGAADESTTVYVIHPVYLEFASKEPCSEDLKNKSSPEFKDMSKRIENATIDILTRGSNELLTANNTAVKVVDISCKQNESTRHKRDDGADSTISSKLYFTTNEDVEVDKLESIIHNGTTRYNKVMNDSEDFLQDINATVGKAFYFIHPVYLEFASKVPCSEDLKNTSSPKFKDMSKRIENATIVILTRGSNESLTANNTEVKVVDISCKQNESTRRKRDDGADSTISSKLDFTTNEDVEVDKLDCILGNGIIRYNEEMNGSKDFLIFKAKVGKAFSTTMSTHSDTTSPDTTDASTVSTQIPTTMSTDSGNTTSNNTTDASTISDGAVMKSNPTLIPTTVSADSVYVIHPVDLEFDSKKPCNEDLKNKFSPEFKDMSKRIENATIVILTRGSNKLLSASNTDVKVVDISCKQKESIRRKRDAGADSIISSKLYFTTNEDVEVDQLESILHNGTTRYNKIMNDSEDFLQVIKAKVGKASDACRACGKSSTKCGLVKGSTIKCDCKNGFKRRSLTECEDVDECSSNISDCKPGDCINTIGSYVCNCSKDHAWDFSTSRCIYVTQDSDDPDRKLALILVGSILGGLCLVLVVALLIMHYYKRARSNKPSKEESGDDVAKRMRMPSQERPHRMPSQEMLYRISSQEMAYRTPSQEMAYRMPSQERLYITPSQEMAYRMPSQENLYKMPSQERLYRTPSQEMLSRMPNQEMPYYSDAIPRDDFLYYDAMKHIPRPKLFVDGLEALLKGDQPVEPPRPLSVINAERELDRIQSVYGPIHAHTRTSGIGSRLQKDFGQNGCFENASYLRN